MNMARQSVRSNKRDKRAPHGIPGDRYVVQLLGNAYYVIDQKTDGIMGGPYRSREAAQDRADALQRTITGRR
jgi:hypothetical protein